ncbi:hypothetical protein L9F63_011155, partial [Diploptera punctata]
IRNLPAFVPFVIILDNPSIMRLISCAVGIWLLRILTYYLSDFAFHHQLISCALISCTVVDIVYCRSLISFDIVILTHYLPDFAFHHQLISCTVGIWLLRILTHYLLDFAFHHQLISCAVVDIVC